ncbi:MAG: divalent-cation tolerance protein CutA [Xanthomonadales bacterium]|nr:divalent-cation tolerance protein CutA [Xanthomonadales bacterium]
MSAPAALIALSTAPSGEEAARLARALVEERIAACVSVVPGLRSIYRWQGRLVEDEEWLLIIKTSPQAWPRLAARLPELHPYEVPELVALPVSAGSPAYLAWLGEATDAGS